MKKILLRIKIGNMFRDKKGVSLMISYVLLILISVVVAISIFAWLKLAANVEPVISCEEGSSINVIDYVCINRVLELTVKNNGRFNLGGFVLTVGDNIERVPISPITPIDDSSEYIESGYYVFDESLRPEQTKIARFEGSSLNFDNIKNIRVQPFIILESGDKIICEESVIRQKLDDCYIGV